MDAQLCIRSRPSRPISVFAVAAMMLALSASAADNEKFWVIGLSLDSPDLVTPAIQWAVFDEDPAPQFKERLARSRSAYQRALKAAQNERNLRAIRSAQISGDWDRSFRRITGDKVYMLTGGPGESQGYSSDGNDGEKWIVTKTVSVHGSPVCWCLKVEVHQGETVQLKLTEKNRFDLLSAYETTMDEPIPQK